MKKIPLTVVLLCCLITNNILAQNFVSEIEQEVFFEYSKDSLNYDFLKSLCVIDSTFSEEKQVIFENRLSKIIESFPPKEIKSSKEKKRIKNIYNFIHKEFFKKYELKSVFTDIFKNGNYNCVSASALYAYVFDELKIPYHVKELPSHVYLIAYPNTLKIYLETTAPGAYGFFIPKDSQIKKMVDELLALKLVTHQEIQDKGYSQVYQDYYYGKKFIDKSSLVGMQYFNRSLINLDKEDLKSAYNDITKSLKFYKSPFSKELNKQLILSNLSNLSIKNEEDLELLFRSLSTLEYKKDIQQSSVFYLLEKITDYNEIAFIETALEKFQSIKNIELKKLIQTELYDYLSGSEAEKRNFNNAIKYSDELLKIDSENKRAKEVLLYCISAKINLMLINDSTLKLMESYIDKYDFLKGDKRIDTTIALLYGQLAQSNFLERDPEEGLKYLTSFERIIDENRGNVQIPDHAISQMYLIIGRYYYGLNKFNPALKYFQKGIDLTPENSELKKMLKWAREDLK